MAEARNRRGGPLTITDCNVLLGRVQAGELKRWIGQHAGGGA
mgnify:CR=1 FL=1